MPELTLIRGLPGAGKTTLALELAYSVGGGPLVEADHYFTDPDTGRYEFDPARLKEAHADCLRRAAEGLDRGWSVFVANTFTQRWEMRPYLDLAERTGTHLRVITVETTLSDAELAARCLHGVPEATIARMRARWEA